MPTVNTSTAETLISTGSIFAGTAASLEGFSRNPSGVDALAVFSTAYGAISGAIQAGNTPFAVALGAGMGVPFAALGLSANVIQLNNSWASFQVNVNSSDPAVRAAAIQDMGDRLAGTVAAIGGLMAAIPVPAVQAVGLGIWLGGTAAQQILNGNAQRAIDIVGSAVGEAIADIIGGARAVVSQYGFGSSEYTTIEVIDRYGISRGEYAQISGDSFSIINTPGLHMYGVDPTNGTVTINGNDPDGPYGDWGEFNGFTLIHENTVDLNSQQFSQAADFLENSYQSALGGNYFDGNSVDFAAEALNYAGYDWEDMGDFFSAGSLADQYVDTMGWFDHDIDFYGDLWTNGIDADQLADWEYAKLTNLGNKLGKPRGLSEIETRVQSGIGSPIAIDLNGDGVKTYNRFEKNINFDITGDGVAERTGWLSKEDAFLALDINENGVVDNVNEMFGGLNRGVGYLELAAHDENNDGVINALDEIYGSLNIWQDANSNGITDFGELRSISSEGIQELNLNYFNKDVVDRGNLIGESSLATINGTSHEMADVYFQYNLPSGISSREALSNLGHQQLIGAMSTFNAKSLAPSELQPTPLISNSNFKNNFI